MKTKIITCAFILGAVMSGLTQGQDQNLLSVAVKRPTGTTTASQPKASVQIASPSVHVINPLAAAKTVENTKIDRVGNMSSRPWTKIVGWHPGVQFVSDADRYHEPRFNLFWIGNEPQ